jgi:hypothetical protein
MRLFTIMIICLTLLITSCGRPTTTPLPPTLLPTHTNLQTPAPSQPASVSTTQKATHIPPSLSPNSNSPYDEVVNLAKADLARRLKTDPQDIRLLRISADEFPAGDLGCPAPGVTPRPIPAIVSGQAIVLEHDSQEYTYHARKSQVVFCGPW